MLRLFGCIIQLGATVREKKYCMKETEHKFRKTDDNKKNVILVS